MSAAEKPRTTPDVSPVPEAETSQKYALLSVFDKTGIVDLAKVLDSKGYRIISTGGTAKTLAAADVSVMAIQDVTGNPESLDGRVKTISQEVEGGILFDRTNPSHVDQAKDLGFPRIDVVVVNLYPFEQTVATPGVTDDEVVEMIDVGGPTMVRSAAKNHKSVLVVTDPSDYDGLIEDINKGDVNLERRRELAAKAFRHLSFYDAQVASELGEGGNIFPEEMVIPGRLAHELRYGENPHQRAAVYLEPGTDSPMAKLKLMTGREMSLTNFTDVAAGLEIVRIFPDEPSAVVIKHNSPCGVALGKSASEALSRAVEADPKSAFGGVVVLNKPMDLEAAQTFANFKEENGVQIDIVAAPSVTDEAAEFIKKVRKTTGIYTFGDIPAERDDKVQIKPFDGGFIRQEWDDDFERSFSDWKTATDEEPTPEQRKQMEFAWRIIGRIKSNTVIVVDRDLPMTRGIGSGQTSRVGSTEIALAQAGKHVMGGILASDSFFPFGDSVKLATDAGIGSIVQQGGSRNDQESIDVANAAGIPMVMTGERKFWH